MERQDEIANMELAEAVEGAAGSALSSDQLAEVRRRRAEGFEPGDPDQIDQLLTHIQVTT